MNWTPSQWPQQQVAPFQTIGWPPNGFASSQPTPWPHGDSLSEKKRQRPEDEINGKENQALKQARLAGDFTPAEASAPPEASAGGLDVDMGGASAPPTSAPPDSDSAVPGAGMDVDMGEGGDPAVAAAAGAKVAPKIPNDQLTAFVKNLSFKIKDGQLEGFFQACGEVKSVRLVKDKVTGKVKGLAYVEFGDEAGLNAGIAMNGQEFQGRQLSVEKSQPPPWLAANAAGGEGGGAPAVALSATPGAGMDVDMREGGDPAVAAAAGASSAKAAFKTHNEQLTAFVKNLSYKIKEGELEGFFQSCREIQGVRLVKDKVTGKLKGLAYIEFGDEAGLNAGIALNGQEFQGRQLSVEKSQPRAWLAANAAGGEGGGAGGSGRGGRGAGGRGTPALLVPAAFIPRSVAKAGHESGGDGEAPKSNDEFRKMLLGGKK
eukprot:gene21551-28544_t